MAEISIIVPVYNVATYLDASIASIQGQTFTDWELLLIDDGSTDDSASIAQRWQDKDSRIKLFRKPNGGVSSARNFGLDHATGKYIMFVDSDDLCHPDILRILHSFSGLEQGITVCECTRFQTTPDYNISLKEYSPEILVNLDEIYNCIDSHHTLHPPYAKLYRQDLIERYGVRFKTGLQLGEDVLFNLDYLKHISIGVFINLPLYFYRDTPGSLSKKIQKDYSAIQLMILSEKMSFTSLHNIRYDYTSKAPLIVRDIALTILRSDVPDNVKIEYLNTLRNHKIMDYCKTKGGLTNILLAQAIKTLPMKVIVNLLK